MDSQLIIKDNSKVSQIESKEIINYIKEKFKVDPTGCIIMFCDDNNTECIKFNFSDGLITKSGTNMHYHFRGIHPSGNVILGFEKTNYCFQCSQEVRKIFINLEKEKEKMEQELHKQREDQFDFRLKESLRNCRECQQIEKLRCDKQTSIDILYSVLVVCPDNMYEEGKQLMPKMKEYNNDMNAINQERSKHYEQHKQTIQRTMNNLPVCTFWKSNVCKFGARCKNLHG
jgi:Skp family chaperone for outer membrane proteins